MNSGLPRPKDGQAKSEVELVRRLASAGLLAVVVALLTVAGVWPFLLLVSTGGVILAWEWGRLVRGRIWDVLFFVHAVSVVLAVLLTALFMTLWLPFAVLAAGSAAVSLLASNWRVRLWSALGILYLGVPCCLLVMFRSDPSFGVAAVFFLFLVVASTDTTAYLVGSTVRGPKLAPSISPAKTWSGFFGGLVVPSILAFLFALWLGATSLLGVTLAGTGLAFASQIGDLVESAIKRRFGVKDSGELLPGHGGLFDRVDGLIGAVLAAGCLAGLRDTLPPSQTFLIWP